MISYTLEKGPGISLYESLCENLRRDISLGVLNPGQKLPSKREFARQLGVSVITVERAFEQLQAEGYVRSRPRQGFFVCEIPARLSVTLPYAPASAGAPAFGGQQNDCPVRFDMVAHAMPQGSFPAKVWARLGRDALLDPAPWQQKSAPGQGMPELREAISSLVRTSRGVVCTPEQVVVGAGSQHLYQLCSLLFESGWTIGIEDPGYPRLADTYRGLGYSVAGLPVDDQGMILQGLASCGAQVVHVSPSHHFPSGAVMPVARRMELLSWAAEKPGRLIVEDDYDCEFRLSGRPIPSLQSIDSAGSVIYMNTFSKTLAPWIRIAYMILPAGLVEEYRRRAGFVLSTVSALDQVVLARFIRDGHYDRHVNRMRTRYRSVRDALLGSLEAHAPSAQAMGALRVRHEDAGLFFLMEFEGANLTDVRETLKAKGVRVACLSEYGIAGLTCSDALVINYSGLLPEQSNQVACLIWEAIQES